MTTVTRARFRELLAAGVDARSPAVTDAVARAGADPGLVDGADLDGDGVVVGDREFNRLFRSVDAYEGGFWPLSVSAPKPLAIIAALQTKAPVPTTPTPTTTTPTTPTPTPTTTTTTTTTTTPTTPVHPMLQAKQAAQALLLDAEGGGINGSELAGARAAIARDYGDVEADRVLRDVLGLKLGALDESGVDWVQRHAGNLSGQIDRVQQALSTHLLGARLIDANFDGRLSDGDVLWSRDASGRVDVKRIEPALLDRVKIGAAFIGAAEQMDTAHHDFALIKDHNFNAKYWTPEGGGTFRVRPGVRSSEAFDDIFKNPSQYRFECATALVITQYKAMRDLLGAQDFDRVVTGLRIGPWQNEAALERSIQVSGRGDVDADAARRSTLRAGDYGYFKNWDVSDKGRADGWQGENVIALGDGRFYGHPFGVADEKTIVDHLNGQRNAGSTRSASFLDVRSQLSSALLAEDRVAGD